METAEIGVQLPLTGANPEFVGDDRRGINGCNGITVFGFLSHPIEDVRSRFEARKALQLKLVTIEDQGRQAGRFPVPAEINS